jgi:hypothetical protein
MSDIGAILDGRWHDSHLSCKIGAMSLEKVGGVGPAATIVGSWTVRVTVSANPTDATTRQIELQTFGAITPLLE